MLLSSIGKFRFLFYTIKYFAYIVSEYLLFFMFFVQYIFLFDKSPYRLVALLSKLFFCGLITFLLYYKYLLFAFIIDFISDVIIYFYLYFKIVFFFIKRLYFLQNSLDQLSHDIQNNLTVINLGVQILVDDDEDAPKQNSKYLYIIDKNIQNITVLLKSFKNQIMFHFPDFDYHDLVYVIENFINQRRSICPENIYTVIYDKAVVKAYCDLNYFNSILYNVIKNAEEADRLKDQKIEIKIILIDAGSVIKIMFIDNGLGFSSKTVKEVFKDYYTTKSYGSGLGMGIIRDLVNLHNGSFYVIPDSDCGRVVIELKK